MRANFVFESPSRRLRAAVRRGVRRPRGSGRAAAVSPEALHLRRRPGHRLDRVPAVTEPTLGRDALLEVLRTEGSDILREPRKHRAAAHRRFRRRQRRPLRAGPPGGECRRHGRGPRPQRAPGVRQPAHVVGAATPWGRSRARRPTGYPWWSRPAGPGAPLGRSDAVGKLGGARPAGVEVGPRGPQVDDLGTVLRRAFHDAASPRPAWSSSRSRRTCWRRPPTTPVAAVVDDPSPTGGRRPRRTGRAADRARSGEGRRAVGDAVADSGAVAEVAQLAEPLAAPVHGAPLHGGAVFPPSIPWSGMLAWRPRRR